MTDFIYHVFSSSDGTEAVLTSAGNVVRLAPLSEAPWNAAELAVDGVNSFSAVAVHPLGIFAAFGEACLPPQLNASGTRRDPRFSATARVFIVSLPNLELLEVLSTTSAPAARLTRGAELAAATAPVQRITDLDFSMDGTRLAVATVSSVGETLGVWEWSTPDAAAGTVSRASLALRARASDSRFVQYAEFGSGQISSGGAGSLLFWTAADTFTGPKLQAQRGRWGGFEPVQAPPPAELPDGRFVTAGPNGTALLWSADALAVHPLAAAAARPQDDDDDAGSSDGVAYTDNSSLVYTGTNVPSRLRTLLVSSARKAVAARPAWQALMTFGESRAHDAGSDDHMDQGPITGALTALEPGPATARRVAAAAAAAAAGETDVPTILTVSTAGRATWWPLGMLASATSDAPLAPLCVAGVTSVDFAEVAAAAAPGLVGPCSFISVWPIAGTCGRRFWALDARGFLMECTSSGTDASVRILSAPTPSCPPLAVAGPDNGCLLASGLILRPAVPGAAVESVRAAPPLRLAADLSLDTAGHALTSSTPVPGSPHLWLCGHISGTVYVVDLQAGVPVGAPLRLSGSAIAAVVIAPSSATSHEAGGNKPVRAMAVTTEGALWHLELRIPAAAEQVSTTTDVVHPRRCVQLPTPLSGPVLAAATAVRPSTPTDGDAIRVADVLVTATSALVVTRPEFEPDPESSSPDEGRAVPVVPAVAPSDAAAAAAAVAEGLPVVTTVVFSLTATSLPAEAEAEAAAAMRTAWHADLAQLATARAEAAHAARRDPRFDEEGNVVVHEDDPDPSELPDPDWLAPETGAAGAPATIAAAAAGALATINELYMAAGLARPPASPPISAAAAAREAAASLRPGQRLIDHLPRLEHIQPDRTLIFARRRAAQAAQVRVVQWTDLAEAGARAAGTGADAVFELTGVNVTVPRSQRRPADAPRPIIALSIARLPGGDARPLLAATTNCSDVFYMPAPQADAADESSVEAEAIAPTAGTGPVAQPTFVGGLASDIAIWNGALRFVDANTMSSEAEVAAASVSEIMEAAVRKEAAAAAKMAAETAAAAAAAAEADADEAEVDNEAEQKEISTKVKVLPLFAARRAAAAARRANVATSDETAAPSLPGVVHRLATTAAWCLLHWAKGISADWAETARAPHVQAQCAMAVAQAAAQAAAGGRATLAALAAKVARSVKQARLEHKRLPTAAQCSPDELFAYLDPLSAALTARRGAAAAADLVRDAMPRREAARARVAALRTRLGAELEQVPPARAILTALAVRPLPVPPVPDCVAAAPAPTEPEPDHKSDTKPRSANATAAADSDETPVGDLIASVFAAPPRQPLTAGTRSASRGLAAASDQTTVASAAASVFDSGAAPGAADDGFSGGRARALAAQRTARRAARAAAQAVHEKRKPSGTAGEPALRVAHARLLLAPAVLRLDADPPERTAARMAASTVGPEAIAMLDATAENDDAVAGPERRAERPAALAADLAALCQRCAAVANDFNSAVAVIAARRVSLSRAALAATTRVARNAALLAQLGQPVPGPSTRTSAPLLADPADHASVFEILAAAAGVPELAAETLQDVLSAPLLARTGPARDFANACRAGMANARLPLLTPGHTHAEVGPSVGGGEMGAPTPTALLGSVANSLSDELSQSITDTSAGVLAAVRAFDASVEQLAERRVVTEQYLLTAQLEVLSLAARTRVAAEFRAKDIEAAALTAEMVARRRAAAAERKQAAADIADAEAKAAAAAAEMAEIETEATEALPAGLPPATRTRLTRLIRRRWRPPAEPAAGASADEGSDAESEWGEELSTACSDWDEGEGATDTRPPNVAIEDWNAINDARIRRAEADTRRLEALDTVSELRFKSEGLKKTEAAAGAAVEAAAAAAEAQDARKRAALGTVETALVVAASRVNTVISGDQRADGRYTLGSSAASSGAGPSVCPPAVAAGLVADRSELPACCTLLKIDDSGASVSLPKSAGISSLSADGAPGASPGIQAASASLLEAAAAAAATATTPDSRHLAVGDTQLDALAATEAAHMAAAADAEAAARAIAERTRRLRVATAAAADAAAAREETLTTNMSLKFGEVVDLAVVDSALLAEEEVEARAAERASVRAAAEASLMTRIKAAEDSLADATAAETDAAKRVSALRRGAGALAAVVASGGIDTESVGAAAAEARLEDDIREQTRRLRDLRARSRAAHSDICRFRVKGAPVDPSVSFE